MKTLRFVVEKCPECGEKHERGFPFPDVTAKENKKLKKIEPVPDEVIFMCSNTGKEVKAICIIPATPERITAQVNRIEDITNDDQAWLEIGKKLLLVSNYNNFAYYLNAINL